MDHISDIDELIAKHLTGEIAVEEQAWLEKWLAESTDNQLYFKQMQGLWTKSGLGKIPLPVNLDVERALAQTKSKIQQTPLLTGKARKVSLPYRWMGIAAAITLLLAAFWFFQQNTGTQAVQLATVNTSLRDTLSDGSRIALNQYSSLSTHFTKKARRVKMQGEAYFEVAPNPDQPFVIEVQQVLVTVVGTKFNIDNRSDPDWVIVSVDEGKVRVQSGTQVELLTAGEQARIDQRNGRFERTQTKPSGNISAWANYQFVFDDVPLSEVIAQLEKNYKVKINLTNQDLADCRLQTRFNNESIDRIIMVIAETFSLEIQHLNGQYFLDGPSCD